LTLAQLQDVSNFQGLSKSMGAQSLNLHQTHPV